MDDHGNFKQVVAYFWGQSNVTTLVRIWQKLDKVKIAVKQLRNNEFSNIEEKINEAIRNLVHIKNIIVDGGPPQLLETTKEAKKTYEKWARIE